MNVLPRAKQVAVVASLLDGAGIRETARNTGINKITVGRYAHMLKAGRLGDLEAEARATNGATLFADRCRRLARILAGAPPSDGDDLSVLVAFGAGCRALHDRVVRDVRARRLALVRCKGVAIVVEPSDRLVLAWRVGRGQAAGAEANQDAWSRVVGGKKVPVAILDEAPPWISVLVSTDPDVFAARVTAWNFASVSGTPALRSVRSPACRASLARDLSLDESWSRWCSTGRTRRLGWCCLRPSRRPRKPGPAPCPRRVVSRWLPAKWTPARNHWRPWRWPACRRTRGSTSRRSARSRLPRERNRTMRKSENRPPRPMRRLWGPQVVRLDGQRPQVGIGGRRHRRRRRAEDLALEKARLQTSLFASSPFLRLWRDLERICRRFARWWQRTIAPIFADLGRAALEAAKVMRLAFQPPPLPRLPRFDVAAPST